LRLGRPSAQTQRSRLSPAAQADFAGLGIADGAARRISIGDGLLGAAFASE